MAKGAWLKDKEKIEIATLAQIPQLTTRDIGAIVGRGESTVRELINDEDFPAFMHQQKRIIDQRRIELIHAAELKLGKDMPELDPRELIGLSKVFYEQLFFPPPTSINIQGEKVAVVIQQGQEQPHSDPETQPNQ